MEKFYIGDVAKLLDVSYRTIRFYEEKGIICPERSHSNQRRYSSEDITRLKSALVGRKLGLPLGKVASMIQPNGYLKIPEEVRRTQIKCLNRVARETQDALEYLYSLYATEKAPCS